MTPFITKDPYIQVRESACQAATSHHGNWDSHEFVSEEIKV